MCIPWKGSLKFTQIEVTNVQKVVAKSRLNLQYNNTSSYIPLHSSLEQRVATDPPNERVTFYQNHIYS